MEGRTAAHDIVERQISQDESSLLLPVLLLFLDSGNGNMTCFLDLSHELLQEILGAVEGADLAALSATCRALRSFVKGNRLLCKTVYLQSWVGETQSAAIAHRTLMLYLPQNHPIEMEPCFESRLENMVKLKKILESDSAEAKVLRGISDEMDIAC